MKINDKALATYACSRNGVDKEGYLNKKGDLNHSYKRRWFVLKGNLLFYFEKRNEKQQPLGMIVLENCSVEVSDCDRFSFCVRYQSITPASRTYTLCAENDVDMEQWMKSITSASFGYIDMLVKEFRKNLTRLKELQNAECEQASAHAHDDEKALLSKVRDLLDVPSLIDFDDSTDAAVPIPPVRKKYSDTGAGSSSFKEIAKIKPSLDVYTINTLNRIKAKSVSNIHRSKSSENVSRDKSPNAVRKSMKHIVNKDRSSAPVKRTDFLDPEEVDKTTFELLHMSFGGAIWTKIGETI